MVQSASVVEGLSKQQQPVSLIYLIKQKKKKKIVLKKLYSGMTPDRTMERGLKE